MVGSATYFLFSLGLVGHNLEFLIIIIIIIIMIMIMIIIIMIITMKIIIITCFMNRSGLLNQLQKLACFNNQSLFLYGYHA